MGSAITPSVPTANGTWRGTGILYKEYGTGTQREIGATRDEIKFVDDKEIRHVDFNGMYGMYEGFREVTKSVQQLTFSLLELTYQNFDDCFAGLAVTDEGAYHKITGDLAIAAGDYHDNVSWNGKRHNDKYAIILLSNALGDGKMELSINDKDDILSNVQFTSHYDPSFPTTVPFEIRLED